MKNRDGDYNFHVRTKCHEMPSSLCAKEHGSVKEPFLKDPEILSQPCNSEFIQTAQVFVGFTELVLLLRNIWKLS